MLYILECQGIILLEPKRFLEDIYLKNHHEIVGFALRVSWCQFYDLYEIPLGLSFLTSNFGNLSIFDADESVCKVLVPGAYWINLSNPGLDCPKSQKSIIYP